MLSPREEHGFAWGQGCRALGWSCGAFSLLFARLKESKRPFHTKNQDSDNLFSWYVRSLAKLGFEVFVVTEKGAATALPQQRQSRVLR